MTHRRREMNKRIVLVVLASAIVLLLGSVDGRPPGYDGE